MIIFFKIILFFMGCIISAAFLTLFERKIIGRIQLRLGPSYLGPCGMIQPFADSLKLFLKRDSLRGHSKLSIFSILLLLFATLLILSILPLSKNFYIIDLKYGLIYIIILHSLMTISEILIGITSKSRYGIVGGTRIYFQSIMSYIPFILSIICVANITHSFNIIEIVELQRVCPLGFIMFPIFIIFVITSLMISNRSPFDFSEAESEIVAGSYTEYGGILFGIIYLSEYLNIIINSILITHIFLGGWNSYISDKFSGIFITFLKVLFCIYGFVVARSTLHRMRQSDAIKMSMKFFVPIIIIYIIFFM